MGEKRAGAGPCGASGARQCRATKSSTAGGAAPAGIAAAHNTSTSRSRRRIAPSLPAGTSCAPIPGFSGGTGMTRQGDFTRGVNVGDNERVASVIAGTALALFGLKRFSLTRLGLAALGASLVYRGL